MTTDSKEAPRGTAEEQKQADLARLDKLLRDAREAGDALEALRRRMAAAVFRCGEKLAEAQSILKKLKIYWVDKLKEYGIAEATATQAVKLFKNATEAGYTADDLESMSITEAKVFFRVIKPPAQIEEERKLKQHEQRETGRKEEPGRQQDVPARQATYPSEGDKSHPQEDPKWVLDIEVPYMLAARLNLVHEEVLQDWNAMRDHPFDEDYLHFLLDLGVLRVEGGIVRYLPDREEDRDELVSSLGNKLAPIVGRWADHDDVIAALKLLVFDEEEGNQAIAPGVDSKPESPRAESGPPQGFSKRKIRIRSIKGGHRP